MSKNKTGMTGGDVKPLPNNFSGALSANAKKMAPKIGPYTPQTSQSNKRGQDRG